MDFALASRVYHAFVNQNSNKKDTFTDVVPALPTTMLSESVINALRQRLGNDILSTTSLNSTATPASILSGASNIIISDLVGFIISCFAAYLSWSCNDKMTFPRRLTYTILAFLFGTFYLVYSISFITTMCTNTSSISVTAVAAPAFGINNII